MATERANNELEVANNELKDELKQVMISFNLISFAETSPNSPNIPHNPIRVDRLYTVPVWIRRY